MNLGKTVLIVASLLLIGAGDAMSQWTQITTGLTTDKVVSLAIAPDGYIYAGTYSNGLYRSTDAGSSWSQVLGPSSSVYEVLSLAVDSSGVVYAGAYGSGLFRSTNDGGSWTQISRSSGSNVLPVDDIYSVLVLPSGTILAADGASYSGEVYRSTDNGSTWTNVLNSAYISSLASNAVFNPSTVYVYAAGTGSGVFHYSSDDGATWTSVYGVSNYVAVAARSITDVFAGTGSKGIYKSTDNGAHWSVDTVGLSNDYINYNALAISSSGVIYAGTQGGGVFYSSDGGAKWTAENASLTNLDVRSVAFDNKGNVYAGTYGDGLWHTGDIALAVEMGSYKATSSAHSITLSWETRSELDNAGFNILRKRESEPGYAMIAGYAALPSLRGLGTSTIGRSYNFTDNGVDNGAVYYYKIEEVSTRGTKKEYGPITAAAATSPATFSLAQNYPNPFNPSTAISYELSANSYVTLKIYDVLGKEVATLVNGRQSAGRYSVTFDANRLPSGVYFYRLSAGTFSQTKKLIVVK